MQMLQIKWTLTSITVETCLLQWSFSCASVCWVSNHIPACSWRCTLQIRWCNHRWPLHPRCACNHGRPCLQPNTPPTMPLSLRTSRYPDGWVPGPHRNKPWSGPSRPHWYWKGERSTNKCLKILRSLIPWNMLTWIRAVCRPLQRWCHSNHHRTRCPTGH